MTEGKNLKTLNMDLFKQAMVINALLRVADFTKVGLDKETSEALKSALSFDSVGLVNRCIDNEIKAMEDTINWIYDLLEEYLGDPMYWFYL